MNRLEERDFPEILIETTGLLSLRRASISKFQRAARHQQVEFADIAGVLAERNELERVGKTCTLFQAHQALIMMDHPGLDVDDRLEGDIEFLVADQILEVGNLFPPSASAFPDSRRRANGSRNPRLCFWQNY